MNAIYKGKLYELADSLSVALLLDPDDGTVIRVPLSDVIVDPTDDEINNILPDYEETADKKGWCQDCGHELSGYPDTAILCGDCEVKRDKAQVKAMAATIVELMNCAKADGGMRA